MKQVAILTLISLAWLCVMPVDACDSEHPCLNGGSCVVNVQSNSTEPLCICSDGFSGDMCQDQPDPCVPNPCFNETVDHFCWTWSSSEFQCSASESCIHTGCEHDGVCANHTCACAPGFEGLTCHSLSADACTLNLCQHGGKCHYHSDANLYECHCTFRYEGTLCESQKSLKNALYDYATAANTSSYVLLGVVVVLGSLCTCLNRHYNRRDAESLAKLAQVPKTVEVVTSKRCQV